MTIALDHDRFGAHTRTLSARAEAMTEQRREIELDVERLLASWQGVAAGRFAEAWQEWRDGADGVIAALVARTDSLHATRDDLAATDSNVGDSGDRLRGRLG